MDANSRESKRLGDFGEGLVTYTLIRKGFEVAVVDAVGADLIGQKEDARIAVSVKTRMFRQDSRESRCLVIEDAHIAKLNHFADRFNLEPVIVYVVCIAAENIIHLFMLRVADLVHLDQVQHGRQLRFAPRHLNRTIDLPYIDYSCWGAERIGDKLFGSSQSMNGSVL